MSTKEQPEELPEYQYQDEEEVVAEAMEFCQGDVPPPEYGPATLDYIVAIPQACSGMDAPFLSCYSQQLAKFNISHEQFKAFMNSLNMCTMANPAFRTASVAGSFVSDLPVVGLVTKPLLRGVSSASSKAVYQTHLKKFLGRVNQVFFAPRDLQVEIKTTTELAKLTGVAPDSYMIMPELRPEHMPLTINERRMLAFYNKISPLLLDDSAPEPQHKGSKSRGLMRIKVDKEKRELYQARASHASVWSWYVPSMLDDMPTSEDPELLVPKPCPSGRVGEHAGTGLLGLPLGLVGGAIYGGSKLVAKAKGKQKVSGMDFAQHVRSGGAAHRDLEREIDLHIRWVVITKRQTHQDSPTRHSPPPNPPKT